MPPKIAMIGAGSIVFAKTLLSDMLATPALAGAELRLMSRHPPKAGPHGGVRPTHARRKLRRGHRLEHARPPRGTQGRRLRHRHDPGRRRGRLQAGLRDPAEVRRRPVHRRLARAGRRLPRPAHHPGPGRHRPGHGGALPDALLLNYANPMAACCLALGTPRRTGPSSSASATACRPRSTSSAATSACPRTQIDLPLRRHQPHGLVPVARATSATARTSTRSCAATSRSRSTTSTRRSAARSCATSATS